MNWAIVAGAVLVLVTWSLVIAGLALVGLAPAVLTSTSAWSRATIRRAIWWGLAIATLLVVGVGAWQPLRSPAAAVAVGVGALAMTAAGMAALVRRRDARPRHAWATGRWRVAIAGCLALGTVYMAIAALGPVTNYDSGLYHLGAIRYAGDFSAIPGLANLYFPFGYSNAEFPLAAFLGNGPWAGEGFRLLNGLLMVAGAIDLALRLSVRRLSTGTFVLIVGVALAWLPMIALSDYWVTSPTSDSAVLFLTIVAAAYVSDALSGRRRWEADAAVAVVLSFLMVALRPTMIAFCVAMIAVVAVWARRTRDRRAPADSRRMLTVLLVGAVGVAGAVTMALRDYLLSGWLLYPLSIVPFDVPWAAADPVAMRMATLGAARDPSNLWKASEGWGWIGAWAAELPRQWETYALAAMACAALSAVVIARPHGIPFRRMALAMAPSSCAVVVWWVASPPSFRFIWGPLFTLAAIPIGFCGASLYRSRRPGRLAAQRAAWAFAVGLAAAIVPVTVYSAVARLPLNAITEARAWEAGPVTIPYALAPIPVASTRPEQLASGLRVRFPVLGDQCWNAYPLCTAQLEPTVGLRGFTLQEGLERSGESG